MGGTCGGRWGGVYEVEGKTWGEWLKWGRDEGVNKDKEPYWSRKKGR